MKKIILFIFLTLTACTAAPGQTSVIQPLATRSAPMDTPTATLDYQATIDAANAGADQAQENSRIAQQDAINAQETSQAAHVAIVAFTAQAEQVQLEYVRATQQIEAWTATAALTNIPATQTQQAINNTQIPAQQMIISTAQAMTIAAPTVAAAMLETEQRAKYGWINYMAAGLMSLTATVLMIWAIIFINHNLRKEQEAEQSTDEPFIIPHDEPVQIVVQTSRPWLGWSGTRPSGSARLFGHENFIIRCATSCRHTSTSLAQVARMGDWYCSQKVRPSCAGG